tara:strand:- start:238 stop:510 length:273 start_codon:yes stop_codon:yes gene_type:complete
MGNMSSKYRNVLAMGLILFISETIAGETVSKSLPFIKDKLTSNVIRFPFPNISLAILVLEIKNKQHKKNKLSCKNSCTNGEFGRTNKNMH